MGYSSWKSEDYAARSEFRAKTKTSAFTYDKDIRSGKAARKCHDDMNPLGKVRESRDSEDHPNSNPVAIFFDVTGSMGSYPQSAVDQLGKMMSLLLQKSFLEDPQILFGAMGDAYYDVAPAQIGQFESGLEMEDNLAKFFIESGGGGNRGESYDLALYFLARKTSCDAFEKRGKKGYAFMVLDEPHFESVKKKFIKDIFGDDVQADIPFDEILAEANERWNVFVLAPRGVGYHSRNPATAKQWRDSFGQNFVEFDADHLCETVASLIGANEGFDVLEELTGAAKESVSRALAKVEAGTKMVKKSEVSGKLSVGKSGSLV